MKNYHNNVFFNRIVFAFVAIVLCVVCAHFIANTHNATLYNDIAEGDVVLYKTNCYMLHPTATDDNSLLLVTWYCGQEYTTLVSCDTPRNAQLTVVFDDCGHSSDLTAWYIIDCIFE